MTIEDLKFVASHLMNCRKHAYKKYRVLIEADSNDNGKKMATILKTAYDASDIADYSGGYRDFSLVFDSVSRRDEVVDNINANVLAYRNSHPETVYQADPTPSGQTEIEITETAKVKDWTTWLVVGAAAVVIILLLWDRKKK